MTYEHAFTFSLFALRNKDKRTGAIHRTLDPLDNRQREIEAS